MIANCTVRKLLHKFFLHKHTENTKKRKKIIDIFIILP